MYVMTGKITFPAWQDPEGAPMVVRKFTGVRIETAFKQIMQVAEITLPRNISTFDKMNVKDVFRVGDPVIIHLGYNGNDIEEFSGYISNVSAGIPIVIKVSDEMWKARKLPVNYVGRNIILPDLLKKIAPGYEIDAAPYNIGDKRWSNKTLGDVLQELQGNNLYSYFIGKKLVCGKYYVEHTGEAIKLFDLERNTVSDELNYKNKEDIVIKINARSITADGKKIEFSLGDDGGSVMKLDYYNITAKAELEKKVREDYDLAKRGGLSGSITGFGVPRVTFGQKIEVTSGMYPDRNGQYYIDGVVKTFDDGGFRQEIELGPAYIPRDTSLK